MGYPNRNEKTDRAGNPPMTLAQLISSSMGGGGSGTRMPKNTYYPSSGMGYNATTGAYEPQMPGNAYAAMPAPNAALNAINSSVGKPFVDDGSITPLSSKTIYAQNPGMVWNGSQMVPAGGRPLPPLPNAVSGTMQRNGGLSLPFFTPKTEQAPQAKPDLGALLGSLFKSTPKPKQLPMPTALPRTYGGTAEAFRGAQARDRLTAPKGGSTYQESQDRLSTLYNR